MEKLKLGDFECANDLLEGVSSTPMPKNVTEYRIKRLRSIVWNGDYDVNFMSKKMLDKAITAMEREKGRGSR